MRPTVLRMPQAAASDSDGLGVRWEESSKNRGQHKEKYMDPTSSVLHRASRQHLQVRHKNPLTQDRGF